MDFYVFHISPLRFSRLVFVRLLLHAWLFKFVVQIYLIYVNLISIRNISGCRDGLVFVCCFVFIKIVLTTLNLIFIRNISGCRDCFLFVCCFVFI